MKRLLIALMLLASSAFAWDSILLPDPALTPGDVLTQDARIVCVPGYAGSVRDVSQATKRKVFARYKILTRAPYEYEIDHLVSLVLGGSNEITNLWPQSYKSTPVNALTKDRLEAKIRWLVCRGDLALDTAQYQIRTNWLKAYETHVGPLPTLEPSTGTPRIK